MHCSNTLIAQRHSSLGALSRSPFIVIPDWELCVKLSTFSCSPFSVFPDWELCVKLSALSCSSFSVVPDWELCVKFSTMSRCVYRWWELPQVSFLSRQKYACRDKTFVATKYFCCDITFVATSILLLRQKMCFVATNTCLS